MWATVPDGLMDMGRDTAGLLTIQESPLARWIKQRVLEVGINFPEKQEL